MIEKVNQAILIRSPTVLQVHWSIMLIPNIPIHASLWKC